jgi:hypothetical protein
MPQRATLALCLALAAPLASALRGRGGVVQPEVVPPGPGLPEVDDKLDALENENFEVKTAAFEDRVVAAQARAEGSASRTKAVAMKVSQLVSRSAARGSALQALLKGAQAKAEQATKASKAASVAVASVEPLMAAFPSMIKEKAVAATEKMFEKQFSSLDSWREKTLHSTHQEAKLQAAKATAPYDKMLNVISTRMQSYQAQALAFAGQAHKAVAAAQAEAADAQAQQKSGNSVGAKQDLELARAMQAQGMQLSSAAQTMQAQAVQMNNLLPQYVAARQTAAARAEFDANPDSLPPMMMDPNFAFTPPPGAAGPAPAPR